MRSVHVVGNIQLDVLASPVSHLPPPGGDQIVDRIEVRPAGAAGNVSLALAALGVPHRLFGALGDDFAGLWVLDELRRSNLADDVVVFPGTATGISIAFEATGRERAFLTAHGVLATWTPRDLPDDVTAADLFLSTGYFSVPGLRGDPTRDLLAEARRSGATTLLDTGWDPEDWLGHGVEEVLELLPLVDVFLPNEPEALALSRLPYAASAVVALSARSEGWVVVKLGERGAFVSNAGGDPVHVPAPRTTPHDTTGAGDSLSAGVLAELADGADLVEAVRFGVAVASAAIARPSDDRHPSRSDVLPEQVS
jgi:sugar/nucleoside kinase (ribokinase family)